MDVKVQRKFLKKNIPKKFHSPSFLTFPSSLTFPIKIITTFAFCFDYKTMKIHIVIIFAILCTLTASAQQGAHYFGGDIYQAFNQAQKQKKLLLAEFYAPWNYKSRWMNQNVLSDSTIIQQIKDGYILVQVDTQQKDGAALATQYQVTNYPNIVVFNTDGNVIDKIDQTLDKEDFAARLDAIKMTLDGSSSWQISQIFNAAQAGDRDKTDRLVLNYFSTLPLERLTSRTLWNMFTSRAVTHYYSAAFDYLLQNRAAFESVHGTQEVNKILELAFSDAIMPFITATEAIDTVYFADIEKIALQYTPQLSDLLQLIKAKNSGNVEQFMILFSAVINRLDREYEFRLAMALDFVAQNGDKEQKRAALKILQRVINNTSSSSQVQLLRNLKEKFPTFE